MIQRGIVLSLLLVSLTGTAFASPTWTVPVGWMGDLTSDGTYLYMTTMDSSRRTVVLDREDGAIVATIEQNPLVTSNPRGAALDGAGHLFLTSMGPDVCELDNTGQSVNCFAAPDPVPVEPDTFRSGAIAFDGTYLYVGDIDSGTILVTDTAGSLVRHFESGRRPEGMAFEPSTGHLWVVDLFEANRMSEITTDGTRVRECEIPYARVPLTAALGGIAIVGSKFYVAEPLDPLLPEAGTLIHVLQRNSLACDPPIHRPLR